MDDNLVELNKRTLKVDRANFFALTRGMERHNETIKTAIYVTTQMGWPIKNKLHEYPQLLTLSPKINTNHPLSDIGVKLVTKYENEDGTPFKYIAVLTTIFHIKNKIDIWNDLCNDGIFDIWNPAAPYNRLNKGDYNIGKSDVNSEEYDASNEGNEPQILLLRVYEIDKEYSKDEIESNASFYHDIKEGVNRRVSRITSLIEQNDFESIYTTVKKTLTDCDAYLSEENINYRPPPSGPNPPPTEENNDKTDATTEEILVSSIHTHIQNQGFTFDRNTIINYYLSLKTKPFVILTGISGSGKTKLTQLFADAVCGVEENGKVHNPQYLRVPVRPDWNDDKYLIGYYNPLTKHYQSTEFLNFIRKALADPEKPYFVCLDEMNLARVEYYFSTFLSAMESDTKEITLYSASDNNTIKTEYGDAIPPQISIPPNLFFTGTVNMDETTYRFSPKVLDRANTLEFNDIDLMTLPKFIKSVSTNSNCAGIFKECLLDDEIRKDGIGSETYLNWMTDKREEYVGFLQDIQNILKKCNLNFGYRTRDEILRYLYFAENVYSDVFTKHNALDFQIKQKILPKIKGTENIRPMLESLRNLLDGNECTESSAKVNQMLEALQNGYTDFYQ